jgi:hypothetical protein
MGLNGGVLGRVMGLIRFLLRYVRQVFLVGLLGFYISQLKWRC